jgi:allantoinase
VGHWAGLVPGNAANHAQLQSLIDGGAMGFKAFMCPSGINDFEHVTPADIAAALPFIKRAGVPLLLHAEIVSQVPSPEVRRGGALDTDRIEAWACFAV